MEKNEIAKQIEKAKSQSQSQQIQTLKEELLSVQTDRNYALNEKAMLNESIKSRDTIIEELREKVR